MIAFEIDVPDMVPGMPLHDYILAAEFHCQQWHNKDKPQNKVYTATLILLADRLVAGVAGCLFLHG